MSPLKDQQAEVVLMIERLEEERRRIYADSHVDDGEHPRLGEINHELEHLWDLKRRLDAAVAAGLTELPVPPPEHPEEQVG